MRELITIILTIIGAFFMFVAGVGIMRMPDLFLRMSATTKAATLGAGCALLAAAIHFDNFGTTSRTLATIIFLLITAPVAAHMIGRAAYRNKVPLWEGTLYDELRERYQEDTLTLSSPPRVADGTSKIETSG